MQPCPHSMGNAPAHTAGQPSCDDAHQPLCAQHTWLSAQHSPLPHGFAQAQMFDPAWQVPVA